MKKTSKKNKNQQFQQFFYILQLNIQAKCVNYEAGCITEIAAASMKDHIENCYYR